MIQIIHFDSLNKSGLSKDVISIYQSTDKVKKYIQDILDGAIFPPIKLYKNTTTIADGIHRICAYLFLEIKEYEYNYY